MGFMDFYLSNGDDNNAHCISNFFDDMYTEEDYKNGISEDKLNKDNIDKWNAKKAYDLIEKWRKQEND